LRTYEINCDKILPQVALPFLPSNAKVVKDIKKTYIDQVVIGSCTNGRIEDLKIAASIVKKGKKVNPNVRTIVIPATPAIYSQVLKEGLLKYLWMQVQLFQLLHVDHVWVDIWDHLLRAKSVFQ
jgi:3-isopropylmalate/(R)-2-methylmalate dehydratase large subunit